MAQTTEWVYHKTADGLHPDGNEQQMLWLMNRARSNPTAEGEFLANTGDSEVNFAIGYFGVNTTLLKAEFSQIAAKPPAAFDRRLYEASRQHSLYLISLNTQNHTGQFDRVTAAGFDYNSARASVYSYTTSAIHGHAGLNIDWGPGGPGGMQAGRGHRAAIMSDQATLLSNVGLALVPETNTATAVGPLVFSGAYCSADTTTANHHNRFLTGTVWSDLNTNNRYDPGEGLNNVRVQPGSGTWHAITGTGGGWAIPVTVAGTYTLTISGGALSGSITRNATIGTESALVDIKSNAATPSFTSTVTRQPNGSLVLTWSGGTPPYQVQRSTTLLPNSWTNVGAGTAATTATVTPSGDRSYYRVVGSP